MTDSGQALPPVLFFNINGSGMGHMSTCLAYANRLKGRARPVFFSLASAIEMIEAMGFEADYFVSHYWSRSRAHVWNRQLAMRLGMMLERVRPSAIVFDGPIPYPGFMDAVRAYRQHSGRRLPLVWSNLLLYRKGEGRVPVAESDFDLLLRLGELGSGPAPQSLAHGARKVLLPPVTILEEADLLSREAARQALGLSAEGRYALFSLGPGNRKDVSGLGSALIDALSREGFEAVWTRAPISVRDAPLPAGVRSLSVYPLARYLRAFDVFVGAAGYNACCEVAQAGLPALFVPNTLVADDQTRRATLLAEAGQAVVSACESDRERREAVAGLCRRWADGVPDNAIDLSGAEQGADEIMALIERGWQHGFGG